MRKKIYAIDIVERSGVCMRVADMRIMLHSTDKVELNKLENLIIVYHAESQSTAEAQAYFALYWICGLNRGYVDNSAAYTSIQQYYQSIGELDYFNEVYNEKD